MVSEELWIVGKAKSQDGGDWEFQGIFDSEAKARTACRSWQYFMGSATLNESLPDETIPSDWAFPIERTADDLEFK